MKSILAAFLLTVSFLSAQDSSSDKPQSSRTEDLKSILDRTYMAENGLLLSLLAGEAAQECQKTIDTDSLMQKFQESLKDEKVLSKFFAPYAVFSDEEVHQLRQIHETPVFVKFGIHGKDIFQGQISTLKETVKGIVLANGRDLASNSVVEVTSANYNTEVAASKTPVILEIYAPWCGACRSMEPTFRELSAKYKGSIRFAKANYDAEPAIAKQYDVKLLPTFVFLKAGSKSPVLKTTGGMSQADFEAQISQSLGISN